MPRVNRLTGVPAKLNGKERYRAESYWEQRYKLGGHSGAGSRGGAAKAKAAWLATFARSNNVRSIVEFGCGDGFVLRLWWSALAPAPPRYHGFDLSPSVVRMNQKKWVSTGNVTFSVLRPLERPAVDKHGELTLSMEVLQHIVDQGQYEAYLDKLFATSARFVAIYGANINRRHEAVHMKLRRFTDDVESGCAGRCTSTRAFEPLRTARDSAHWHVFRRLGLE